MRRRSVLVSEGLTERIDQARGQAAFETWVAEAIEERLTRDAGIYSATAVGPIDELYAAVVELQDGNEGILLMKMHTEQGDTLVPVLAHDEEGVRRWTDVIGLELNAMDGPPVRWRVWRAIGAENLDHLRAPTPQEPE